MIVRFTTGAAEDAPTGTRTRDSSLGPRCDPPLHHWGRPIGAEGEGFEPSFPAGTRFSRAARLTVSGSLPSRGWLGSGPPGSRTPISGVRCRRRPVGPAARVTCDRPPCYPEQSSARGANPDTSLIEEACRHATCGPAGKLALTGGEPASPPPEGGALAARGQGEMAAISHAQHRWEESNLQSSP